MGKVVVTAHVANLDDMYRADRAEILPADVRQFEIPNALVDTGATNLCLPKSIVAKLGLKLLRARPAITSAGSVSLRVFGTVRLTIQGRECVADVVELPDECPALVGQVPLELMDFVVDPGRQRIIGNPEHGGEQVIELY